MGNSHWVGVRHNYSPGSNSDPYRDYWNGHCYERKWTGNNMSAQRVEVSVRWTIQQQRKGGVWWINEKWKEGEEKFQKLIRAYARGNTICRDTF